MKNSSVDLNFSLNTLTEMCRLIFFISVNTRRNCITRNSVVDKCILIDISSYSKTMKFNKEKINVRFGKKINARLLTILKKMVFLFNSVSKECNMLSNDNLVLISINYFHINEKIYTVEKRITTKCRKKINCETMSSK